MRYVVDRIEGMTAVCEDEARNMVEIPLHALPFRVEEGTTFEENAGVFTLSDNSERHLRIGKLMDNLWN